MNIEKLLAGIKIVVETVDRLSLRFFEQPAEKPVSREEIAMQRRARIAVPMIDEEYPKPENLRQML